MTQVLLIDGPMAGQMVPYERAPIVYDKGGSSATSNLGLYEIHKYVLFGRMLRIGSCEPGAPSDETMADVFWTWLASDDAQIMAIRPEGQPSSGAASAGWP